MTDAVPALRKVRARLQASSARSCRPVVSCVLHPCVPAHSPTNPASPALSLPARPGPVDHERQEGGHPRPRAARVPRFRRGGAPRGPATCASFWRHQGEAPGTAPPASAHSSILAQPLASRRLPAPRRSSLLFTRASGTSSEASRAPRRRALPAWRTLRRRRGRGRREGCLPAWDCTSRAHVVT